MGALHHGASTHGSPKITELSCTSSIFLHFLDRELNTLLFNKQHNLWHRSFQNSIAFIRVSCFSNPQLYTLYISIAIFEYLNHPCHGPLIANTFTLQYQKHINNTELSFYTLPFCTRLKWLKILVSPTWSEFTGYVLDTMSSFPTI